MLQKGFRVWIEKWDCRCEERWLAQSTGVWQFGKLRRSEVVGEEDPEMERSREKTSLGQVLGERLEQVFCHDLRSFSLRNYSGGISGSSDIVLAVFFVTMCLCKCFSTFRDDICDFRRPPGFSRAVDAAQRNGRSGRIIEEFGKGVSGFRKRKFYKVRGSRAVGINISKVIVPASFIVVK